MSDVIGWSHWSQPHVTKLHNIEKIIEGSAISDVIQYSNNILVL